MLYSFSKTMLRNFTNRSVRAANSIQSLFKPHHWSINGARFSTGAGGASWDRKDKFIPIHGVKVGFLKVFEQMCGGRDKFVGLTATEVSEKFIKPMTESSSLCDVMAATKVEDFGAEANTFVCYARDSNYLQLKDSLELHFKDAPNTVIWLDLFSFTQHKTMSFDFHRFTYLKLALHLIGHTLVVLTPLTEASPIRRSWCLFEMHASLSAGARVDFCIQPAEEEALFAELSTNNFEGTMQKLLRAVDTEKSVCEDQQERSHMLHWMGVSTGIATVNAEIHAALGIWMTSLVKKGWEARGAYFGDSSDLQDNGDGGERMRQQQQGQDGQDGQDGGPAAGAGAGAPQELSEEEKAKAEETLLELWDKRKQRLGEGHEETLQVMHYLAEFYVQQSRHADAARLLEECLNMAKVTFGTMNPATLTIMMSAACNLVELGQYEQAEGMLKDCWEKRKVILGAEDMTSISTLYSLGKLYERTSRLAEAKVVLTQCFHLAQQAQQQAQEGEEEGATDGNNDDNVDDGAASRTGEVAAEKAAADYSDKGPGLR
jgi:hypothetical protein